MTTAEENPPRILFYVQHLLGIGHLKRAATLARAFEAAGLRTTLVSGGHEVPGLDVGGAELVQLDPVRAVDKYFKVIVGSDDMPIDDAFKARRRDALLSLFERTRPDAVITELFPFGRRQLRFELLPLLDAAKARSDPPLIVSSVRDILVEPGKPERLVEMLDRIETYYDLILIHGDPDLIPFDETFPHADRIRRKLRYTGYVVDRRENLNGAQGRDEVIVSAGGGAVSDILFRAAMAAREKTRLKDKTWRFLAGHAMPEDEFQALKSEAGAGMIVERARPDFIQLLANCALSISQGGYNTVMEVMTLGARGVIVPYAGGLETEQTLRARLIGERAGLQIVEEGEITPDSVAAAAEAALDAPPANTKGLDTSGAETSARILRDALQDRG